MRKKNTIKNFITSIIPYIIFTLLSIFKVKLFLSRLGDDIYAANQLFSQLFTYISLVEGGVGALIIQKYYKHFINNSHDEINKVYSMSIRAMNKISFIIFVIGFVLSFFIKFLTNNSLSFFYLQFVFILYVLRSIIEYLNLSPRFVIQADQKLYKINIILNFYKLLEIVMEILLLFCNLDYVIILIVTIIIRITMYYFTNRKIRKEYPWLHKIKIDKNENISGVGYMFWHKISGNIKSNTDIILLSITQSSLVVSCYASYNYIIKCITDVIYMIGTAMLSSYGNVVYSDGDEKSYEVFKKINLIFLFLASLFCVVCYVVFNKFILLWVGEKYVLNDIYVIMLLIILFQSIASKSLSIVFEARGLYKETKNIVAIEALINLCLSIILVSRFSMGGVLFATIVSGIYGFVAFPSYIYNNIFKVRKLNYFLEYIFVFVIFGVLSFSLSNIILIEIGGYLGLVIETLIIVIITIIIEFIIFYILFIDFRKITHELLEMLNKK